jgi:ANTAR domain
VSHSPSARDRGSLASARRADDRLGSDASATPLRARDAGSLGAAAEEQLETLRALNVLLLERVEQLQTALDSRVVIEQAKGVLAARLDVEVEQAFELLRVCARTHRMKLRELAAEVVSSRVVPAALAMVAARNGEGTQNRRLKSVPLDGSRRR